MPSMNIYILFSFSVYKKYNYVIKINLIHGSREEFNLNCPKF